MSGCNNQLILIIFAVKDEKFCSFMIFKDSNPNSRTFQGLEFSFANSTGTYFQGPWQPCIQLLFLVTIPVLWLVSSVSDVDGETSCSAPKQALLWSLDFLHDQLGL